VKFFSWDQQRDAITWAAAGGQALHCHPFVVGRAPAPFVRAGERGELIAHLFDWDRGRLHKTALGLGVKRVYVHRAGQAGQHVDLCARPLERAAAACAEPGEHSDRAAARVWLAVRNLFPESVGGPSGAKPVPTAGWVYKAGRPPVGTGENGCAGWVWWHARDVAALPQIVLTAMTLGPAWADPDLLGHALHPEGGVAGVMFKGRPAAMRAAATAAARVPAGATRDAILGEWLEGAVALRHALLTPKAFSARFRRVFNRLPGRAEVAVAFGRELARSAEADGLTEVGRGEGEAGVGGRRGRGGEGAGGCAPGPGLFG